MRSSELLALGLLTACPELEAPNTGPPELTEVPCSLGTLDADGEFSSLDGGEAELVLGFQGFLFVELVLRTDPHLIQGTAYVQIEVDGTAHSSVQPEVATHAYGEHNLSDVVLAFLSSGDVAALVDRPATFAVRLENADLTCLAVADAVLVDDDPCIHTDDEPICPEPEER